VIDISSGSRVAAARAVLQSLRTFLRLRLIKQLPQDLIFGLNFVPYVHNPAVDTPQCEAQRTACLNCPQSQCGRQLPLLQVRLHTLSQLLQGRCQQLAEYAVALTVYHVLEAEHPDITATHVFEVLCHPDNAIAENIKMQQAVRAAEMHQEIKVCLSSPA
jgi:hypothetical protein